MTSLLIRPARRAAAYARPKRWHGEGRPRDTPDTQHGRTRPVWQTATSAIVGAPTFCVATNPNVHTGDRGTVENPQTVEAANEEQLHRELTALVASTRNGELTPTDFSERLDALDARFLGEAAHRPEMVERRRAAAAAYDQLTSGKDLDTHHHLEKLAEALGVDLHAT